MSDHAFSQGRRGRPSKTDRCVICGVVRTEHPVQTEHDPLELLTHSEVAAYLKCSTSFLQEQLINPGVIPQIFLAPQNKPHKRMPRVSRKDLEKYIDEMRAQSDGL